MKPEDLDQLKELVAFLKENEIAEFEVDRGDLKVRLKFTAPPAASSGPSAAMDVLSLARLIGSAPAGAAAAAQGEYAAHAVAPVSAAAPSTPGQAASAEENLHILKSPIVGTFYESPSPGSSAYVSNGDHVEKGQVICIVEAMKLMNEIEADASGEIVKRLVNNGQAIEYGQPLFAIRIS